MHSNLIIFRKCQIFFFYIETAEIIEHSQYIQYSLNQNTHKLCVTPNIRQNCHNINALSPEKNNAKKNYHTPQNHTHTKTLMKSSPQKQQKDISDLIEIFCLQMFLFFTSTIL